MQLSHVPVRGGPVFPRVRGSNLNGRTFDLPADFERERNLVIVAFQRNQQALVETWTAAIRQLLGCYPDLRFYELPTISRGNPLFRAWLDGAMRSGIPDHESREQTITLYLDKLAFRQALALADEDTIYVLLVDRGGRILWRAQGEYSAQVAAELDAVLARGAHATDVPSSSDRSCASAARARA